MAALALMVSYFFIIIQIPLSFQLLFSKKAGFPDTGGCIDVRRSFL